MRIVIDVQVTAPKLQKILLDTLTEALEEFTLPYNLSVEDNVFNQTGQTVHGNQVNVRTISQRVIETHGGSFVGGSLNINGDFVGRDKITVRTDDTQITVKK